MPERPDDQFAHLIRRLPLEPPGAHPWNANHDELEFHHGPIAANAPAEIVLNWVSKRRGTSVRVGVFRLYPRALINAGYCADEGKSARVRFFRRSDGTVVLQANASAPAIEVGLAHFG